MAVLAPMPSASVSIATALTPGFFDSIRRPYRRSCQTVSIIPLLEDLWCQCPIRNPRNNSASFPGFLKFLLRRSSFLIRHSSHLTFFMKLWPTMFGSPPPLADFLTAPHCTAELLLCTLYGQESC